MQECADCCLPHAAPCCQQRHTPAAHASSVRMPPTIKVARKRGCSEHFLPASCAHCRPGHRMDWKCTCSLSQPDSHSRGRSTHTLEPSEALAGSSIRCAALDVRLLLPGEDVGAARVVLLHEPSVPVILRPSPHCHRQPPAAADAWGGLEGLQGSIRHGW